MKNYRIQLVKCKKCGDILSFGEGTINSSRYLFIGRYDYCNCGNVRLYPIQEEEDDERIVVDPPLTMDDVEDLSLTYEEAPPPEHTETMYAWFKKYYEPRIFYCSRGVAPWEGICFECNEAILKDSPYVRFSTVKDSIHVDWAHAECADNAIRYATLKQKKYRVHRLRCKYCGGEAICGEGIGMPDRELFSFCRCECGKVGLYPYEREQYRIQLWKATPDVVEDLSVEWEGEDTFPDVYKDHAPWPGRCYHCLGKIPEGSEFVRYRTPKGNVIWLHPDCAEKEIEWWSQW